MVAILHCRKSVHSVVNQAVISVQGLPYLRDYSALMAIPTALCSVHSSVHQVTDKEIPQYAEYVRSKFHFRSYTVRPYIYSYKGGTGAVAT